MPLRDHFHSPVNDEHSWDELHGLWPGVIVLDLFRKLPRRYVAAPTVRLGTLAQIDVVAFDRPSSVRPPGDDQTDTGGTATAVWAPPKPTLDVPGDPPDQDEYEVRVYDTVRGRRLVAAVEIVSPSNKDRSETRREFVAKCAGLLRQRVSVAIVDLVTEPRFNLYVELLDFLRQTDPSIGSEPSATYAAECRWTGRIGATRLQTWSHPLVVGQPLPTLPLWLAEDFAVKLELETTYEEACRTLRIA